MSKKFNLIVAVNNDGFIGIKEYGKYTIPWPMIKEDMDYMGPVRLRDVEEAQQKIVNIIRKLEDAGEIVISRGGGDEIIV